MSRLCDLFPQPKPMNLGGGQWLVSQYRLRDLGFLENWIASRRPEPFADPGLSSVDARTRRLALRRAYERGELPSPRFASEEAERAYATPEGGGWLVWLSLHQCQPDMVHAEAVEIAAAATVAQWAAFERAAWAIDPMDELDAMVNAEMGIRMPEGVRPKEMNFAKAFVEVTSHTPMSLKQFGNLTLTQWRAIITGGEAKERSVAVPSGWTLARFEAEYLDRRKAFFDETEEAIRPEVPGTTAAGA